MITILVADDEQDIREVLVWYLQKEGFKVLSAADGNEALRLETQEMPDLLILDVMMPGLSGWEIAETVTRNVPILFLTALGEEQDRLKGFQLGADDYIAKPFSPREVIARVRAVLRRNGKLPTEGKELRYSDMTLQPAFQKVIVGGDSVELSTKEFELLYFLARHPKTIFSREKLMLNLWGYDFEGDERTVDTTIKRIRAKLGEAGNCVKTIRGKGYKFEVDKA